MNSLPGKVARSFIPSDTTIEVDNTGVDYALLDEAVADAKRARASSDGRVYRSVMDQSEQ